MNYRTNLEYMMIKYNSKRVSLIGFFGKRSYKRLLVMTFCKTLLSVLDTKKKR